MPLFLVCILIMFSSGCIDALRPEPVIKEVVKDVEVPVEVAKEVEVPMEQKVLTYNELIDFIDEDPTDLYSYDEYFGDYQAIILSSNADKEYIKNGFAIVDTVERGDESYYVFNCFETSDKGVIYISSVGSDDIAQFTVGGNIIFKNIRTGEETYRTAGKVIKCTEFW